MVLEKPAPVDSSPLRMEDVTFPVPRAGQIRVRVLCCGVCHTDLHIVEGELALPRLPLIPGHQIVGRVDAVGPGVRAWKEGDRLGVPWLFSTCGDCADCRRGLENLCENARFTGYHVDGGYAEYMLAGEDFAYPIPPAFSDESAAPLLCAGVIGYRSYRLSGIRPGERLGLYGFGGSAHLVLQMARHFGCEVYVFTRSEAHLRMAADMGAKWTGRAEETPPEPLDAAIIFAPAGALIPQALRVLRRGGTVALAGITMSRLPQMDYSLLYYERGLRSVANSTRNDCREFLELAKDIPLRTEIQIFDLAQANEALTAVKHSSLQAAAAVLRIGS